MDQTKRGCVRERHKGRVPTNEGGEKLAHMLSRQNLFKVDPTLKLA